MNAPNEMPVVSGVRLDLSNEEYHSGPGVSNSGLGQIDVSPYYYWAMNLNPDRPERKDRAGQLEGTLAHCAILEPGEFTSRYVMLPADAPRRPTEAQWNAKNPSPESRAAMDWWLAWNSQNSGKVVITVDQYDTAMRQAESAWRIRDFRDAIDGGGIAESSAFWFDRETGVLCRCRPDFAYRMAGGTVLFDVKTYSSADPQEFARQAARKTYHRQDAMYSEGYEMASGSPTLAFVFIAVETEYPWQATAMELEPASRAAGYAKYRSNLKTYAECMRTNDWPGYSTSIEQIELPSYAL